MQPQHKAFLKSLDWTGWQGTDGRHIDCEDKDLNAALDQLSRMTQEIIDEYEERQSFTSPSKERRDARQKAEYRQQKRARDRPTRGSS
ncbi:ribosomal protein S21 [Salinibacter ruber]|uniref:30S ribosomal protein S21 n=1 Tax=Salinibacter ruber TaxID=146919 RepID=UPI0021679854|nr:30S ribosomal protein S21 [Salinibacter ruber]MCS3827452.1 ribosomal protein S21 [Salinibacter ruber]